MVFVLNCPAILWQHSTKSCKSGPAISSQSVDLAVVNEPPRTPPRGAYKTILQLEEKRRSSGLDVHAESDMS